MSGQVHGQFQVLIIYLWVKPTRAIDLVSFLVLCQSGECGASSSSYIAPTSISQQIINDFKIDLRQSDRVRQKGAVASISDGKNLLSE